jgi:TIGR00159 family protein
MAWWAQINHLIATIGIWELLDIILVAFVIYQLYRMIRDTRALALSKGIIVLLLATLMSRWLDLHVIYWLLQTTIGVVLVALPVVFQPELRRALEKLGRVPLIAGGDGVRKEETQKMIRELSKAASTLSKNSIGALIVIEQGIGLGDYVETGIEINGKVSSALLINIFIPNTPLHDGAVIIRGDRIMSAGSLLPLSEDDRISKDLGTRHRAGIGMSEQSDAVVLIVSEETGTISISHGGILNRMSNVQEMTNELEKHLILPQEKLLHQARRFFSQRGGDSNGAE